MKPGDAQVYVDGYFSGLVDDFDGMFQKLNLEVGVHHIEVRADGYETLALDVRIEFDQTVTYKGELKKLPADAAVEDRRRGRRPRQLRRPDSVSSTSPTARFTSSVSTKTAKAGARIQG